MINPLPYRPLTKQDWLDFINTPVKPPKQPLLRITSQVQLDALNDAIRREAERAGVKITPTR